VFLNYSPDYFTSGPGSRAVYGVFPEVSSSDLRDTKVIPVLHSWLQRDLWPEERRNWNPSRKNEHW